MIGEGAYDSGGHRNAQFLSATNVGPYPGACMRAWKSTRDEAMRNLGLRNDSEQDGWKKIGPLAHPTLANARNRSSGEKEKKKG